ncbi:MAG TPA: CPBP family intramembrane glutamic endopeptidase [Chitinophagaceae bacterium]|nr:CPBP family intramembrane glutamic endopeptidase [Chitinophagaceae bacterium]
MVDYDEYNQFKPVSPSAAFFILLGLLGAGLIIGALAGAGIWMAMTGRGIMGFEKDIMNPQYANAARIMQMVSVLFMFFIPALVTARLLSRRPFAYLGYREGFNPQQLLLTIAIILLCLPLVGALGELTQSIPLSKSLETYFKKLEDNYNMQVEALATMHSPGEFIFSLVVMALFPAIFEETIFRGALQQVLIAWFKRPMLAIVITSIIFSAVHISFYGFLPRFALGVVLGLLFYYSKSIWLNMTAHFINNAFALSYMYYLYSNGKPVRDAATENAPIWIGIPALLVVVLLLRVFQRVSSQRLINKIPPMDGPSLESTLV